MVRLGSNLSDSEEKKVGLISMALNKQKGMDSILWNADEFSRNSGRRFRDFETKSVIYWSAAGHESKANPACVLT